MDRMFPMRTRKPRILGGLDTNTPVGNKKKKRRSVRDEYRRRKIQRKKQRKLKRDISQPEEKWFKKAKAVQGYVKYDIPNYNFYETEEKHHYHQICNIASPSSPSSPSTSPFIMESGIETFDDEKVSNDSSSTNNSMNISTQASSQESSSTTFQSSSNGTEGATSGPSSKEQEHPHTSIVYASKTILNPSQLIHWQYFKFYYQQLEKRIQCLSIMIDAFESSTTFVPFMTDVADVAANVRDALSGMVCSLYQYLETCESILKILGKHFSTSGPLRADSSMVSDPHEYFKGLQVTMPPPSQWDDEMHNIKQISSMRTFCLQQGREFYAMLNLKDCVNTIKQLNHLFLKAQETSGQAHVFQHMEENISIDILKFRSKVQKLQSVLKL